MSLGCAAFDSTRPDVVRLGPRTNCQTLTFEYCTACAVEELGVSTASAAVVAGEKISAKAWVNGIEYAVEKTIKELAEERERNRHLGVVYYNTVKPWRTTWIATVV